MKKHFILFISIVLCLSLLIGCGNDSKETGTPANDKVASEVGVGEAPEGTELDAEQVFTFSHGSAVLGLNPLLNTTAPDNGLHSIILETLVSDVADENGNAVMKPAAAKDWTISADGTVYTFNIREDANWNDGVPVTANDFVYTFRQMATPAVGSTNAWLFDGIITNFSESLYNDGINPNYNKMPEDIGVKAINDKTVEFTLVKPYGYFLDLLDGAKPVRQDKFEEWGNEYGSSFDKVVTNGPFVIESWNQNVQMTLVKNEKYWDADNVKLDKINRKVIQDPATAAQALLSGEIDVVGTNDPDWKGMILDDGRFNAISAPGNAPEFYGFNLANKYLKNEKIRIALSISVDREKFVDDLRNGEDEPLYSLMPAVTNVGDQLYSERVNGKNEIIKTLQAEYPDPKALLIEGLKEEGLDPDPAKMKLRFASRGTSEFSKKNAEWLLQQWQEKLGIEIEIDLMEWNVMWDKVDAGDYDICTSGWGPYYNDPNALLTIYEPIDGYFNSTKTGWSGPDAERYTELLKLASDSADNQERAELFLEAEEILVGKAVIVPTYVARSSVFLADYVYGYYTNPHSQLDYTKLYITGKK